MIFIIPLLIIQKISWKVTVGIHIINNWFLIIIGLQSEAVLDVIKDLIGKARKHGRRQARTFYSQLVEIIEEY